MFDPNDVRIDTYQNAAPGAAYNVKATHTPTGIYTHRYTDKSWFRARKKVMEELAELMEQQENGTNTKV